MSERRRLGAAVVAAALLGLAALARAESEAGAASAAVERPRRNMAQLDLGLGIIGLAYERAITTRLAVQLEAQYFSTWFIDPELSGFGAQVRPSFFVTGAAPAGVYLAPYLRVDVIEGEARGGDANGYSWSAGAFVGYAHLFAGRYSVRAGAGVQRMHYTLYPDGGGQAVEDTRTLPALDLVLGWVY